jgi:hypothetical protein
MKLRKRYTPPPGNNARHLGPVKPQAKSGRSEAETVPPPAIERNRSGVRARKSQQPPPAATVDEVTADMSKDPRRED